MIEIKSKRSNERSSHRDVGDASDVGDSHTLSGSHVSDSHSVVVSHHQVLTIKFSSAMSDPHRANSSLISRVMRIAH
jgi:hypothetical protein